MADGKVKMRKVTIIGSGPAGWTAAIYLSRANMGPVVYAGAEVGGQLTTTTDVENYPGFPNGVDGPKLMMDMEEQAKRYGTEVKYEVITGVDFTTTPLTLHAGDYSFQSHAVIICTGAKPKLLGLESEQTYWNRGVHTCAVCDGGFYKDRVLAVVGGGDTAMEEATYLSKLAKKVYVLHRRDELRASKIMADRVLETKNIEVLWSTVADEVYGEKVGLFPKVTGLKVKSTKDGSITDLPVDAMFLAIGHTPNSEFLNGAVETDSAGYVLADEHQATNVRGVYAAGDIHDSHYRQAITAAGFGCKAALEVERFLIREGLGD